MGKITIPTPIPNPVPARNGIRPNANVFAPQIPSKEIDKNVVKAYAVDTARDVVSNGLQTAGFVVGALINERNYNEPDVYPDGYHVGTYVHPTTNMFGNDFIGAITFCPGGQTAYNSNDLTNTITLPEIKIDVCLISIENRKEIVNTKVIGRNGTIKQFISSSDYDITIELIVTMQDQPGFEGSYNGIYPYDIVKDIMVMADAPVMVRVSNDHLQMLDINYICITNVSMEQEEGSYSQQRMTINCQSDDINTYKSILNY